MDVILHKKENKLFEMTQEAKACEELRVCESIIDKAIDNVQLNYLAIAEALSRIKTRRLYYGLSVVSAEGLAHYIYDIEEYAYIRFGMSRTTVHTAMGIYEAFCKNGGLSIGKFSDYSYSQLAELLPLCKKKNAYGSGLHSISCENLPEWVAEEIPSDMPVKQIRAVKKKHKEKSAPKKAKVEENIQAAEALEPQNDDISDETETKKRYEILELKNDEARKQFIKSPCEWDIFAFNQFLGITYRRVQLSNGAYIIALEWNDSSDWAKSHNGGKAWSKYLFVSGEEFRLNPLSDSYLVGYLRSHDCNPLIPVEIPSEEPNA